jgi:polyisoprenyl-phosphate glycosyltransferase
MISDKIEISVVLPVFNEEMHLQELYENLISVFENKINTPYEIIFVNDGSIDKSLDIIRAIAKSNKSVLYIDLSRNFGHQIASTAGIEKSRGNFVVLMDSDFQDPPELIPELLKKAREGFDVVYAKRKKRKGESIIKKITAKVFYRLLKILTRHSIPIDTGDFRIISRKVVNVLSQMQEQEKFLRGQIAWIGFKQSFVEFDRPSRRSGKSGYSTKKMFKFAIDGITSFSDFPLRFATFLGFLVSIFAFVIMLWALYQRLVVHEYVQGWTSLILSVLFIGGIQLICIGIIGEYISRIGSNIRKRPLYVINETNIDEDEDKE